MARSFTWYVIPAGTKARECRGSTCGAIIYDIPSLKTSGAIIPISVDPDGAFAPTFDKDGYGISHFQDCPDVAEFSRKR